MFSFSPKLINLLIQTTKANDLESAFQSVLSEYLQLKLIDLEKRMKIFEIKWDVYFFQFQDKIKNKTLGVDSFSYEVECDYWEWEDTLTLMDLYQSFLK
jgi:hypothetical protein